MSSTKKAVFSSDTSVDMPGQDLAIRANPMALSSMSVEDLKRELSSTLNATAVQLVHLANVWQELQRRGVDLSGLRSGLWQYMTLIASGELEPELVVRYAGNFRLLRRLAGLPRYEQQIIIENDVVPIAERIDNEVSYRMIEIGQLTAREASLVFQNKILSRDEQAILLARRERLNRKGSARSLRSQVIRSSIRSAKIDEKPYHFRLGLSDKQMEMLRQAAKVAGVSMPTLIIKALEITGLVETSSGTKDI